MSGRLLDMMSTCSEMVSTKLFLLVRRSSSADGSHINHPVSCPATDESPDGKLNGDDEYNSENNNVSVFWTSPCGYMTY